MLKLTRKMVLLLCVGLAVAIEAYAYDRFEAGQAAGHYLGASKVLIELKNSKCGYAIKKPVKSMSEALRFVLSYLDEEDQEQIVAYVNSASFRTEQSEFRELVIGFIREAEKDMDSKTVCGFAVGTLGITVSVGFDAWDKFVKKYKLHPKP